MKLLLLVMIGCILPALNTALKCYVCNSGIDKKECVKPGEKFVKECPSGTKSCSTNEANVGQQGVYVRGCSISEPKDCKEEKVGEGKHVECFCDKDKCNGSNFVSPNKSIFLFMFIVILASFKN